MGMIYRRKKRDPTTGDLCECGPYWMKYYMQGRPIQESTRSFDRGEAKNLLKQREGEVAIGLYRGPKVDRIKFEDLAVLIEQDYQLNKRKTSVRVQKFMLHLEPFFRKMRASRITTDMIKAYMVKRQNQGSSQRHNQSRVGLSEADVSPRVSTDTSTRGTSASHSSRS